ncbi:DUF177 domain-containing protein [Peptoniphilus equinus]|uniref:DUF177 domain-containing protein n=1 Tax=Peptoniphilus equinus TaxID=3016343 RepID=A0ABY7QU79_9FIRM|nr:DUF177 domain-containing protein [Peptoniphilus equinus]WBW50344.1 DUF177 domain-containing protein [Peptoniphilus equinus]
MRLTIKEFLAAPDQNLHFEGQLEANTTQYDTRGLEIVYPVHYDGVLTKLGNSLKLDLDVRYSLATHCDLCLKPMTTDVQGHMEAYALDSRFDDAFEDSDLDTFEIEDETIDVDDQVMALVITSQPLKTVCSDTCQGLCPQCGADLNLGPCGCDHEAVIDLRFEKLKNLFNDEEV